MKELFATTILALTMIPAISQNIIYQSSAYSIYPDRVVQGAFEAKALSDTHMVSNYKSPSAAAVSSEIAFKFSINQKDNEMLPNVDHHFNVRPVKGEAETPLIVFGRQLKAQGKAGILPPETRLKIRVDMREVLKQFKEQGFYTTYKGDKIFKEDFKGLYVAGNTAPMDWDFDNLHTKSQLKLTDDDGDGIYETSLILNAKADEKKTAGEWKLSRDIAAFPQYSSDQPIVNALYNMALEEMENAVEKDSTLRTGKEWAGVWTRDVSYSTILSMAYMQPRVAMNSLLRKVTKSKRIIQDTGTGGAWPISTDRMIWAVAAFEIYKVTGYKNWLAQAYEIIKNSIDDDLQNVYDPVTGMVKGESSFLDWREQTYPKWMQPADIFESECLGTNVVHYQANMVLSAMAKLLNKDAEVAKYEAVAERIRSGINQYLWLPSRKYYGQYAYGRNYMIISPRSEALGEALSVIFDVAPPDRQSELVASTPVTAYGIPCIYPQIPGIPPYHNNGIWPFVQSFWLWAAAKVGNEKSVMESMAAIYRPAALFLTNKENFVADNGDFSGTVINSSNMLWSLSGNLSIIHKVIFGVRFLEDGITFSPFVPKVLAGKRSLINFKYRSAIYNIHLEGYGNKIKAFYLDGIKIANAALPATIEGIHNIRIELANNEFDEKPINKLANKTSLASPNVSYANGLLSWQSVTGARRYNVFRNGNLLIQTRKLSFRPTEIGYAEYQVMALDANNISSFASEPLAVANAAANQQIIELEKLYGKASEAYKGYSGDGFVELTKAKNRTIRIPIEIKEAGSYAIDLRYANGNGPTNTENKCAIRNLKLDNEHIGTIVMPQRGKGEWSNWGMSNAVTARISAGAHTLILELAPFNENMNGEVNDAMLDYIRITRLDENVK